ncbi:hypothetical protein LOC61_10090 [Arthrobacter sp. zg-Y820]|nr:MULTISPECIES: hypothetical protein [unclassified Arthrobacter]MCC9197201.1 hypothetical protein [Arthrobacter sp. zg-Y820]MDK1280066.1 hypothetical protein [Arthrobacter sp. zg.Y820]
MQGFGMVYLLFVAALAVLAVWALVLLIIFLRLRLRIAEMRAGSSGTGISGPR